jgi:hypothetical protein
MLHAKTTANTISLAFNFVFLYIDSPLHRSFGDHQVQGIGHCSNPETWLVSPP